MKNMLSKREVLVLITVIFAILNDLPSILSNTLGSIGATILILAIPTLAFIFWRLKKLERNVFIAGQSYVLPIISTYAIKELGATPWIIQYSLVGLTIILGFVLLHPVRESSNA